jgi:phytoene/squalene synthetase
MIALYHEVSRACSALLTRRYSTSFSSAIRLLHTELRAPICGIYGFVRVADEIVDTFHDWDKQLLLSEFTEDTWKALDRGLSTNPVLHSFAEVVRRYNIPKNLIEAFLHSMALDLHKSDYISSSELDEYIYGSAEVVGLMCLCVFVDGDMKQYEALKDSARRLGAAFQKVNFLRDLQADFENLNRSYFPGLDVRRFDADAKARIEADIESDFDAALEGVRRLPLKARFGVYTAYRYYAALFRKIRKMAPHKVLEQRIRVPDASKLMIVARAGFQHRLGMI